MTIDNNATLEAVNATIIARETHTLTTPKGHTVTVNLSLWSDESMVAHVNGKSVTIDGRIKDIAPQSLYAVAKRFMSKPVCVSSGGSISASERIAQRVYSGTL